MLIDHFQTSANKLSDMASTVGKPIKCRAAVAWKVKEPLTIEIIQVDPPQENEVRVKMVATGVCHSDLHMLNEGKLVPLPTILGHEGAGIVESVGKGVTTVAPGDHVIPLYIPQCRECKFCKHPRSNTCIKDRLASFDGQLASGGKRFTCKGVTLNHCLSCSTFSEYIVTDEIALAKINKDAPLDKVCLIGCAIPTGYGAVVNTAQVEPGSTCAIFGLGGIGLAVAMGCRIAKAKRIIGIDIKSDKFEIAKKFGCTEFINPTELDKPIAAHLIQITEGGVDYAFECVGNVGLMKACIDGCTTYGKAITIGIGPPDSELSLNPMCMIVGKTWTSSLFGGWKGRDALPMIVEKYMKKEVMVDEFITHTMPLEKINEAFTLMKEGKSIRSVIIF